MGGSIRKPIRPGGLPLIALMELQGESDTTGETIFLLGAAVAALVLLGYLLIRRFRQYPVDSSFDPGREIEKSPPSDEDVETFL